MRKRKRKRKMTIKTNKQHPIVAHGLRSSDAAEYLGLQKTTLAVLRTKGGGPPFTKLGRLIFYDLHDLDAWIRARKYKSTADYETT